MGVRHVPFCGTRVGELEFPSRVICLRGSFLGFFLIQVRKTRVNMTRSVKAGGGVQDGHRT